MSTTFPVYLDAYTVPLADLTDDDLLIPVTGTRSIESHTTSRFTTYHVAWHAHGLPTSFIEEIRCLQTAFDFQSEHWCVNRNNRPTICITMFELGVL